MAEPGGLPSMWSHRVGHDLNDLAAAAAKRSHQDTVQYKWQKLKIEGIFKTAKEKQLAKYKGTSKKRSQTFQQKLCRPGGSA